MDERRRRVEEEERARALQKLKEAAASARRQLARANADREAIEHTIREAAREDDYFRKQELLLERRVLDHAIEAADLAEVGLDHQVTPDCGQGEADKELEGETVGDAVGYEVG